MLSKTPSRIVIVLIVLNLAFLSCLGLRKLYSERSDAMKQQSAMYDTAAKFDKAKFMRKSDYVKLTEMGQRWHKTGRITDAELKWSLDMLDSNPNPSVLNGELPQQSMVFYRLMLDVKEFTPTQTDALYDYSLEKLKGDGGNIGNGYRTALSFAKKTKEKRLIPYILPLLESKDPDIKIVAQKTITYLDKH